MDTVPQPESMLRVVGFLIGDNQRLLDGVVDWLLDRKEPLSPIERASVLTDVATVRGLLDCLEETPDSPVDLAAPIAEARQGLARVIALAEHGWAAPSGTS